MPGKVIDASVLGAVVFAEQRAEEALGLIAGAELYAPTLLPYELSSIARRKARRDPAHQERYVEQPELGLAREITLIDVAHPAVCHLALETGLSTYDASYLYLARSLALPLVTFDQRLAAAAAART